MARLDQHLESTPSLGQTLAWLTSRFVIDAHQRIAYSKLPEFTFRFRWEEGRLRFYSSDPRHFEPTDIRLDAISRIAEDLGLLDREQNLNTLTPPGRQFLTEVFGSW